MDVRFAYSQPRLAQFRPMELERSDSSIINSPADGESKHGAFVKTLNIILPKSFIFTAKFSRPVE